ncbi:MAG: Asp-tRNA(Asn)/Glu-tRNA(Gln) amidotransferase subunit GatB [Solirubrobacteraceae bacterium]
MSWEPVIGLEIHVQLQTRTKMFCACALGFAEPPNTRTCPVCLGLPGSLPVVNERAIHFGLMIGLALDCELAPRSIFHRKNYFYPDLPKGYQISQYDEPLCGAGRLGEVRIHRVHLEEDAAKLTHIGASGRIHGSQGSVVDFNRGGTPLVEIVTEPDVRSPEQAREWLGVLRETLRALDVSDVNMEEGSLRCDANVSLRPAGSDVLGTKTELKNMNSFRYLERGVQAEIARQSEILDGGGEVEQQTLHFDPASGAITALRSKEEAHDYRYFPEPDLVPIAITAEMLSAARAALPELPAARAARFERSLGINAASARLLAFRSELGDLFEAALAGTSHAQTLANWVERFGEADPADSKLTPTALAELVEMIEAKELSGTAARQVWDVLRERGGEPRGLVASLGLGALDDAEELAAIVAGVISAHADVAAKVRSGNANAIGALIGPAMKATRGRADGARIRELIIDQLQE